MTDTTWHLAIEFGYSRSAHYQHARGLAAKKKLEDLVLGKRVAFEFRGAGMYNRVRGVVHVDGVNVNEAMKKEFD